ncbi:MAG: hypothetical protein LBO78_01950 [Rickettsiales bacterium]|jgi:hypothetical protein|nr:hypothetical protein [Rickettsiales bacterium]
MDNIMQRFTWKIFPTTAATIAAALYALAAVAYVPADIMGDTTIRGVQFAALALAFITSLKSQTERKLFAFTAMAIAIIAFVKLTYGMELLTIAEGKRLFGSWGKIGGYEYGAEISFVLLVIYAGYYYYKNDLWSREKRYLYMGMFPAWDIAVAYVSLFMWIMESLLFGDGELAMRFETLFYISAASIIYLYAFDRRFSLKSR